MAKPSEAATTVDPQKWLGMLQRWCPAVPTAELVAFINLLIEAAGPRRVEWLDDLIVQADSQLRRTGAWKMNRLKQYAEAMSKNPRHLPRLRKLRGSRDFDVALKILKTAGHGMSADEVLPAFRQHRAITRGALVNVLSKYPPAKPGALVLEPLKAACPCRTRQSVPSTLWNAPHLMTC